jgi:hypothetical protein
MVVSRRFKCKRALSKLRAPLGCSRAPGGPRTTAGTTPEISSAQVSLSPDAEYKAALADSAQEIAVEEKGPSTEHGFRGQPRQIAECAVDKFFETSVTRH